MESVMNHRDYTRKYSVNISEVKEKALNTLVAFGCILRPRLVKQRTIVCLLTEVNPHSRVVFRKLGISLCGLSGEIF